MSTGKERMETLLAHLKMNPNEFASSLGYKRTDKIYNILRERNGISSAVARDIHNAYSRISYEWLVDGEGEMLVQKSTDDIIGDEKFRALLDKAVETQKRKGVPQQWQKLAYEATEKRKGMIERIRVAVPEAKDVRPSIVFQHLIDSNPTIALWAATGKDDKVVIDRLELEALRGQLAALRMLNDNKDKEIKAIRGNSEANGELLLAK